MASLPRGGATLIAAAPIAQLVRIGNESDSQFVLKRRDAFDELTELADQVVHGEAVAGCKDSAPPLTRAVRPYTHAGLMPKRLRPLSLLTEREPRSRTCSRFWGNHHRLPEADAPAAMRAIGWIRQGLHRPSVITRFGPSIRTNHLSSFVVGLDSIRRPGVGSRRQNKSAPASALTPRGPWRRRASSERDQHPSRCSSRQKWPLRQGREP